MNIISSKTLPYLIHFSHVDPPDRYLGDTLTVGA
jgi:hypothetical protein